jgi:hypothetical protein
MLRTSNGVGHDAVHFAKSVPQIFTPNVCHLHTWDGRYLHKHQSPEIAADAIRVLKARHERKGLDDRSAMRIMHET